MSVEFAIANDEGIVEANFASREEAEAAIRDRYSVDDELTIVEVCEEHPDEERGHCEQCDARDEEESAYETEDVES